MSAEAIAERLATHPLFALLDRAPVWPCRISRGYSSFARGAQSYGGGVRLPLRPRPR